MKRFLFILILLAANLQAQSPTAFRSLDLTGVKGYGEPVEYDVWAGSSLSYPIFGSQKDFNLSFGLSGKVVIDFFNLDLGRDWYVLTYGDFGLPNYNNVGIYQSTANAQEGLAFGLQVYTIFGSLQKSAFTAALSGSAKLNTFGTSTGSASEVYSYRFDLDLESSIRGGGLPLIFNLSPAYVLLADETEFVALQNEISDIGFWTSDVSLIVPVGGQLGLLLQSTFAESDKPLYRLGVIISAGM